MKIVLLFSLVLFYSGCSEIFNLVDTSSFKTQAEVKKSEDFHTNLTRFNNEFQTISNKEDRNKLIDELLTASNMECNAFLYKDTTPSPQKADSLYTTMFKLAGKYIGLDIANDAIDAVSTLSNREKKQSNQDKYAQALKPNIIKAVQISRKNYLKNINESKKLGLKEYSLEKFKEDLDNYDKRCSTYYGLLEINKALEKQNQPTHIDIAEVKTKIKKVTKEVTKDKTCQVDIIK